MYIIFTNVHYFYISVMYALCYCIVNKLTEMRNLIYFKTTFYFYKIICKNNFKKLKKLINQSFNL